MQKRFRFLSILVALSIILSPISLVVSNMADAREANIGITEELQGTKESTNSEETKPSEEEEQGITGKTEEPKEEEFELQGSEDTPFEFDEETGTITGYKDGNPPADLVIPAEINGVPVKHIGDNAFYYSQYGGGINKQLNSVVLPEGLESLGYMAFQKNNFTSIELPSTLTTLGKRSLAYNQLTAIEFPESLTSIGEEALMENKFTEIEIPSHIEEIQAGAFKTNLLTNIILHEGLKNIGAKAFEDNSVEEINIPSTVQNWPTGKDEPIFRRNNRDINNKSATDLILAKVYNNSGATAKNTFGIVNPASVTIEYKDSKGAEIASSKTIVGKELKRAEKQGSTWIAVEGSGKDLSNYDVDKSVGYNLINVIDEISENYYQMNKQYTFAPEEIEEYITPESQTVTLNDRQNIIAFTYTKEGEEPVEDPTKPASIELSFPGGQQITPLYPGDKQIIFAKVLNGDGEELEKEEVTFESSNPAVLRYLYLDTFKAGEVSEETTVTVIARLDSNPEITGSIDVTVTPREEETSFEFDEETGTITGYKESEEIPENLVIPEEIYGVQVKHIGNKAFSNKKNIKEISFPNTLETIGEEAFRYCELGEVYIPGNIKEIKKDAFNNAGLTKITFEEGIEKLEINSFANNSINEVIIPNTVEEWPEEGANAVFSANKIKIDDWTGKVKFARVYNNSGATPENTFGIVNPASVTMEYKDEEGKGIKNNKTVVGKELKKAENIGTSWEPNLVIEEGSKEYLLDYNDPYDIGWGIVLGLDELSPNYYQMNKQYTFEPEDIEGYITPESQTVTLNNKENTIVFTYTKEGEEPVEPVTPIDLDEEIEFLKQCYEAYMTEDSSGSTGNAGLEMMAPGAARLAGMDVDNIQKHLYIDEDNKSSYQLSQSIITLIGADLDPRQYNDKGKIRNLVKELEESQQSDGENEGEFVKADSDKNSVEAQARSVIALDMAGGNYNKEKIVSKLIEIYDKKGDSHTYKDIKTEGIVLLALSNHKDIDGVHVKIDEILAYLKTKQNKDGGFDIESGFEKGTNSPTATGRVIQGLIANGINPLEDEEWIKNGSTMLNAIVKSKTVKDNMKNSGYGKGEEDEYTYYEATYTAFGALMDLKNQRSMFELLRLQTDPGVVPDRVEIVKPDRTEMEVGQSLPLTSKVYDKDGKILSGQELIWTSSNENIAAVTDGNVEAKSVGEATITVTVNDTEIRDNLKITVVEELKTLEVNTAIIVFNEDGDYEIKSAPQKVIIDKDEYDGGFTVFGSLQATTDEYEGTAGWITSIYGITGPDTGGWMFTVNDKIPDTTADKVKLKEGDKVIWFCTYDYMRDEAPTWKELTGEEPEELTIRIIADRTSVKVGEELPLTAEVRKGDAILTDKEIMWLSSNAEVATIDKSGKLTAHKEGEVNITAALAENKNIKDTVKIRVAEKDLTIEDAIEALRKYYFYKDEFTFRAALGYNFTSDNLEEDLIEINSKFETNENPESVSEHVSNIMGLIAAGENPYSHNNKDYVKSLVDAQNEEGKFIIGKYDDYSTILAFSVSALDMADADYNKDNAVKALLSYQKADGSFGGVDETGMVLTALARHRDKSGVQTAIDTSLNYLRGEQDANTGGFIVWGSENPYSASAVLQGLIAAGEDPLSEKWTKGGKTMVDSLMNFYKDGHFEKESEWNPEEPEIDSVTEQAFIALADVYKGKSMFNEIRLNTNEVAGIKINKPDTDKITEGETIKLFVTGYDEKGQIVPVKEIEWTSSDNEIAEVDKSGRVTTKKPGNVTITAKVKGNDIKDSIVLEIHEKEFEIEYIGDIEVKNGQQANAKVKLRNLTEERRPATLIITLYDNETNRLLNYSIVKKELEGKEELELTAGFLVPDTGNYCIKAFLWDDLKYQNIIMQDAKEIKVAS